MADEDLWEAARARTREDVREIFARTSLAFVRLSRECTAARGPVFGSGYLIEPRR